MAYSGTDQQQNDLVKRFQGSSMAQAIYASDVPPAVAQILIREQFLMAYDYELFIQSGAEVFKMRSDLSVKKALIDFTNKCADRLTMR